MGAQHAELKRETSPVVVAATAGDFDQIGRTQTPLTSEVILARRGREGQAAASRRGWKGVIGRH
jgi:hypothetical protein